MYSVVICILLKQNPEMKTKTLSTVSSVYPYLTLCSMFNQKNIEEYRMSLGEPLYFNLVVNIFLCTFCCHCSEKKKCREEKMLFYTHFDPN